MGLWDKMKQFYAESKEMVRIETKIENGEALTDYDIESYPKVANGRTVEEYKAKLEKKRLKKEAREEAYRKMFHATQESKHVQIDEDNRLFRFIDRKRGSFNESPQYAFEDLKSYELLTNNESQVKGGVSLGGALSGGLWLGEAGMLMGGLSGSKKGVNKITSMEIYVRVNEKPDPKKRDFRSIRIFKNSYGYKPTEQGFKSLKNDAENDLALFDRIVELTTPKKIDPSLSIPDEIHKYKELLDEGILTQEEFDAKKKELLNL